MENSTPYATIGGTGRKKDIQKVIPLLGWENGLRKRLIASIGMI